MVGVVYDKCYVSRGVICFVPADSFNLLLRICVMRNLTPHAIVISVNGVTTTIEPSGVIARVSSSEKIVGACPITGAPIVRKAFGSVIDIGTPDDGPCLVSSLVLSALGEEWRGVAFAPDTGAKALRNDKGHIIGVTQLVTV